MGIRSYIRNFKESHHQDKVLAEFQNEMFHIFTFLALIMIASGLASLGLMRGNIAVVIGAMLITPLVSPFVGLGLVAVTGHKDLFEKSFLRCFLGPVVFWGIAFLVGKYFADYLAPDALVKAPLIDIPEFLIAIFAGTIAALAMASEKIYNRLSGAAIALSLAPPLAISGIGFALGEQTIFQNGFLLFGINALGLVIMSFVIFFIFGFRKPEKETRLQ